MDLDTITRREWNKSGTSATLVGRQMDTKDTGEERLKNFHFDNGTSENIFTTLLAIWQMTDYNKNYFLEMPRSHAKMRSKSAPQKLNFVIAKVVSKNFIHKISYKCPCTFKNSHA